MSIRSRVAFATGAAGLVGSALLLTGRFDGNVVVALLFVAAARFATPASLGATRALAQQAWFAPAWAVIVAAGVLRAGSPALSDARGANAVAGLALTHGSVVAVVGAWLAIAAGVIAIASRSSIAAETAMPVVVPPTLRRLEAGAVLAQSAFIVTLFAGPHVAVAIDAVSWVIGIAALTGIAWCARDMRVRGAPVIAFALAAIALVATLAGGAP